MQDEHSTAVANGYERYFGLAESPFKLTSSPRFLFESASYLAAFKEIGYALSRREPIVVVTGPIGTGKTTLCRMIGERRGPRTVVAVISAPPQTVDDLFRQVLDSFGLLTDDTKQVVEASHYALLKVFQQFLDSLVALQAQAILVFDEAQHLGPDILEQVRLLSNLDTDHQTLQIVLVGQPELDDLLARTDLGQVDQRISRRHRLEPLQPAEVPTYVDRRLSVAQVEQRTSDRPTFTGAAMEAIATLSRGVPRVVNIICDRSLENAWSDGTHTVDTAAVVRSARSLNIDVPPSLATASPAPPSAAAPAPAPATPSVPTPLLATPSVATPPLATPPLVPPLSSHSKHEYTAYVSKNASVRVKQSHIQIAIAAVLVTSVVLFWFVRGGAGVPKSRNTTQAPAAVHDAARPAPIDRPAPGTPASPVVAVPTSKPVVPPPASSTADKFLIIVSSFRTRDRATQVAKDIVAVGLPASVRTSSGWEQVVVGPYTSRQEAVAAQGRLEGAHFADTKLVAPTPPPAVNP